MTLTCRRGLRAGLRVLRSPAKPEYRGLCCAARVLNAIHYPGTGAVVISPMRRGEVRARAEQTRVKREQHAKELGRSNSQRGKVGLQAVVDQEGWGGELVQRQGGALVRMLGTEPREGFGSQQGDGEGREGWCLTGD